MVGSPSCLPRTFLRRNMPNEDLPRVLQTLKGAPKRASALTALNSEPVDEAEFRAACQVDATTLRALIEKGLVLRDEEPAQISLALDRSAVHEAVIRLRGAEKHAEVLRALSRHPGPAWIGWVYTETGADLSTLRDLEAAGLIAIEEEMIWRDPLAGQEFKPDRPPALTPDQERAWELVLSSLAIPAHQPGDATDELPEFQSTGESTKTFLLHGVTGSGKTEIYLRAIAQVLRQGQQAVVLVPEIALTPQTVQRFAARFPGQVTVWHSELSDGERFDMWRRVRTSHPAAQVVVGSRSALFLPFPGLGLIVVDEEHESSYKQIATPRYHARTAAIALGRQAGIPVLLGSATPALETYYAARSGAIRLLTLPRRVQAVGGAEGATMQVSGGADEEQGGTERTGASAPQPLHASAPLRLRPPAAPLLPPRLTATCHTLTSSTCGRNCAPATGACSAGP